LKRPISQNSILEKNLEIFLRRFPHYSTTVQAHLNSAWAKGFWLEEIPEGFRLIEQDEYPIDSTEQNFYPPFEKGLTPARILIGGGFGAGIYIEKLLQSAPPEAEAYVVVEPSWPRFLAALSIRPLDRLLGNEKIRFCVGLSAEELLTDFIVYLISSDVLFLAKAYQFFIHPVVNALHPNYFLSAKMQWENALGHARISKGHFADSLKGFKNSIENLGWIRNTPGICRLKKKFEGSTAVVVSTGPSLTKSLPLLKEYQDKILILAADASLKILLEAGITPHFVFSLERDLDSKPFFENLQWPSAVRSHLIAFPMVPSEVIHAYTGPHWVAYRDYEYFGFFETQYPRSYIHCGPSVAHMAVVSAEYFGCEKVVLVGQDLAYDPDRFSSHADGVSYANLSAESSLAALEKLCVERGEELFWVEGNLRAQVPTSTFYWMFLKIFVDHARKLKIPLLNATAGGAKIPEVPWISLAEALKGLALSKNPFEILQAERRAFVPERPFDWNVVDGHVASIRRQVGTTNQLLRSLISTPGGTSPAFLSKLLEKVRAEQKRILSDKGFQALVSHFAGPAFIDLEWEHATLSSADSAYHRLTLELCVKWYAEAERILEKVVAVISLERHSTDSATSHQEAEITRES